MATSGSCLGIDLGTTSVKVSLIDIQSKLPVFSTSEPTNADIDNEPRKSEQDVSKIMHAVCICLTRITDKNRACVKCICVSGQMHGILLWNSDLQMSLEDEKLEVRNTSNLFTWQDHRASSEYIAALPKPDSHQNKATGFGCVTLFWMAQFQPEVLVHYNTAGGIMDYLVVLLCGLDKPVMSDQIASSWGYFSSQTNTWNFQILREANFPVHVLPVVERSGSQAGTLCTEWFGIPKGTPVLAGLGDLQCSFVSGSEGETDAVINMSTSSQVCYPVLSSEFIPRRCETPSPISFFPFFNQKFLAVAASLNGGNTLSAFVKMLQNWFGSFGVALDKQDIWQKLTDLSTAKTPDGVNGLSTATVSDTGVKGLVIQPLLFGERHDPTLTGSVSGAHEDNLSLGCVFQAMCEGLVNNLHQMMPVSMLIESGITSLVLTGSVIDRQPYVKDYVKKLYAPLTVKEQSGIDASVGAGRIACKFLETLSTH
ncbi:sedoheptulokinase-like [Mercenaria mercenaria]|uniref:sedoheptulokinase-like n=1 Tax=Mercenaria mercenaria TaxID=6596 RepID=UPI00234E8113|nr:sedoheptulokinase-like [Mercenaria mercenaria]XP_045172026.2 sedoheptulokinase-like [Mercenaria mercenaria]XP_045172027.2 sedoheptulokinase-like [Mercenaria mercenaria]